MPRLKTPEQRDQRDWEPGAQHTQRGSRADGSSFYDLSYDPNRLKFDQEYLGALYYFEQACRDWGVPTMETSAFRLQPLRDSGKSGQDIAYSLENDQ